MSAIVKAFLKDAVLFVGHVSESPPVSINNAISDFLANRKEDWLWSEHRSNVSRDDDELTHRLFGGENYEVVFIELWRVRDGGLPALSELGLVLADPVTAIRAINAYGLRGTASKSLYAWYSNYNGTQWDDASGRKCRVGFCAASHRKGSDHNVCMMLSTGEEESGQRSWSVQTAVMVTQQRLHPTARESIEEVRRRNEEFAAKR